MTTPTQEKVLEPLRSIVFEPSRKSLVDLGMVLDPRIRGARVSLTVELPAPAHPRAEEIAARVREAVGGVPGVDSVDVETTWRVREGETARHRLPGVKHLVAVASGKGGVGKSTVAANLAAGLARLGAATGLMDLDLYGPSVPLLLGRNDPPRTRDGQRVVPAEAHGLRFLSMGQFAPGDRAVIWRGPMLHKMVTQLAGAEWGELDYLVLDLPPGTGDVQLTLTQQLPVTGAVVVTTPQEIALLDARRGLAMFREARIPNLGIVENLSWYECRKCGKRHAIFGEGGGARLAAREEVPLLARLPLDPAVVAASDAGRPIVLDDSAPAAAPYRDLAVRVAVALGDRSLERNPFRVLG